MRAWLARIAHETGSTEALTAFGTTDGSECHQGSSRPAERLSRWRHCGQETQCPMGKCACGEAVKDEGNGGNR